MAAARIRIPLVALIRLVALLRSSTTPLPSNHS
jgi:hypothetical protein